MGKEIIKGNQLQLFINNLAPTWSTSHTLTLGTETSPLNTKDFGLNQANIVTGLNWELQAECLYSDTDADALVDLQLTGQPITVTWAKVKNWSVYGLTRAGGDTSAWVPDVKGFSGKAFITNITQNANAGDNATYSITFTGTTALKSYDNTTTDYSLKVTYSEDIEGMTLFDMRAYPYINSGWVSDGNTTVQIDISDGKLHDATPSRESFFIFYLSGPTIPEYMFNGVNTVDTVIATNTIYNVGQFAFNNSSLTEISIPGPTPINYGNYCFSNCTFLTHVNYASGNDRNWLSAKHVNNSAFLNCVRLEDCVLGDDCEYILFSAFDGCLEMRNVWFGSSLRRVNERAFLVDSQASTKTFHFYTEKAPYCQELAFGNVGYQTFILHNSSDARDFVDNTDMATLYPIGQCDYQIA